MYVIDLKLLKLNLKKLYSLVYGNCTDAVQTILKVEDEYKKILQDFNCFWLLKKINVVLSEIDTKTSTILSLHTAIAFLA